MTTDLLPETPNPTRSAGHETCHHELYGMNCAVFELLLARAGGHCEFCGVAATDTPRQILCIDHDSRYGWAFPRGMICDRCNAHFGLVDSGKRPRGSRETAYYSNAWFKECGWYADGGAPDVRPHADFRTWTKFRKLANRRSGLEDVLRQFMHWYTGEPGSTRPTRPDVNR